MTPKLVVLELWKKIHSKSSHWKREFQKKKFFQLICTDKTYKTMCQNFLKQMGLEIFNFWWFFWFRKTVLHHKIINKTWSTKSQENSAHHFGVNYLTNHLVKFLQNRIKPWGVGALTVRTGYHFFLTKIVSEGFPTSFNFPRDSS